MVDDPSEKATEGVWFWLGVSANAVSWAWGVFVWLDEWVEIEGDRVGEDAVVAYISRNVMNEKSLRPYRSRLLQILRR